MQNMQGTPILVLREGTQRTSGRDAQRQNIMAARTIAQSVKSTLGPKGMDKMLVNGVGDIVITNDGVTILKEMDVEHPAAKMVIEVAKTQENEVGDGTTTAVVIAGELLKRAEELLDQDIHPTLIARGYRLAAEKAKELLNEMATPVSKDDDDILQRIAATAMTGKGAEVAVDKLSEIAVKSVKSISEESEEGIDADTDFIKVEKRHGGNAQDTELIDGIVIDKEIVNPSMPKKVNDAKMLLLESALEVKDTETDAQVQINDPDMLQKFVDQEEKMLKDMVDKVAKSGANVVLCQKGIDDLAQYYLAKQGVIAVRRVKKSDLEKIAKATGGRIMSDLRDISEEDLGNANLVEEKKVGDEKMVFITGCQNPKAVTILVRGGTEHIVDEIARGIEDAIRVVTAALRDGKVVPGGGALETAASLKLNEWAPSLGGREQLAVEGFAKSLEVIPRTLAENAGLDPINSLVELKSAHEEDKKDSGIDVNTGKIGNMREIGVLEPISVKTHAISSADEVAVMLLRIDDVVASKEGSGGGASGGMGGGMGGGMPPMGGMM
ncbi:MAG: thermosome subunit alpha [Candidatus Hadarchaeota archaeon]